MAVVEGDGVSLMQNKANEDCLDMMRDLLHKLKSSKPEERTELARRYAVTITELEKVLAYFYVYVMSESARE